MKPCRKKEPMTPMPPKKKKRMIEGGVDETKS